MKHTSWIYLAVLAGTICGPGARAQETTGSAPSPTPGSDQAGQATAGVAGVFPVTVMPGTGGAGGYRGGGGFGPTAGGGGGYGSSDGVNRNVFGAAVGGGGAVRFGMGADPEEVRAAEARLKAVRKQAEKLAEKVSQTRSRVDAGLAPRTELTQAEAEHQKALADVAEQEAEMAAMSRALSVSSMFSRAGQALSKPVDVQLQQATVRQAAEALSKASGVKIEVAEAVPKDVRITIEARRVPLATVLEAIGNQTGLMIAPQGDGVLLDVWPSLKVDGKPTPASPRTGRMAPWSDEWIVPPTSIARIPGLPRGVTMLPSVASTAPMNWAELFGRTGGGRSSGTSGTEVSVSGDTVVVSEVDSQGKGLWITAYRMREGRLEPAGSTYHPFQGATAQPAGSSGPVGPTGMRRLDASQPVWRAPVSPVPPVLPVPPVRPAAPAPVPPAPAPPAPVPPAPPAPPAPAAA